MEMCAMLFNCFCISAKKTPNKLENNTPPQKKMLLLEHTPEYTFCVFVSNHLQKSMWLFLHGVCTIQNQSVLFDRRIYS